VFHNRDDLATGGCCALHCRSGRRVVASDKELSCRTLSGCRLVLLMQPWRQTRARWRAPFTVPASDRVLACGPKETCDGKSRLTSASTVPLDAVRLAVDLRSQRSAAAVEHRSCAELRINRGRENDARSAEVHGGGVMYGQRAIGLQTVCPKKMSRAADPARKLCRPFISRKFRFDLVERGDAAFLRAWAPPETWTTRLP